MRRALGLLVVALAAAGCAPAAGPPTREQPALSARPVWPPPPARPRIRFVQSVSRPADLGVEPSFWERLGQIIVGRQEEWLIRPMAVAARGGLIYVADAGAQAVWALDTRTGRFRKVRTAGQEPLTSPVGVAVGTEGRVYVVDSFLRKIFILDAELRVTTTIAGQALHRPAGLAFDATRGRLYVADSAAHTVWVYTGEGKLLDSIGRRGTGQGEFNFPTHVAVDGTGTLYVTDSLGFRIQMFTADGRFTAMFGRHGDASGEFARPKGVALDSEGHIYVVEALFDAVQIFDRAGRFLLGFGERGLGPGQFWLPTGVFIDPDDRIYVADAYNQRVQVFEYLRGGGDE
jgi:DNA-binding beta-propeller fold protein YncE